MTDLSSRAIARRRTPVTLILMASTALVLASFAVASGARSQDSAYEPLPILKASDLLSAELLRGDLHEILETVENDGYENSYTITSEFGTFTAHRTDYVAERVQEVYALKELSEITKTDAFAAGVAQAATSPFRALKSLATEPVGTVTGAVRGIGALFSQAGEMVTGSRGEQEDSAAGELVGYGLVKREVANLLEVDPYTTNVALQDGMGEVAWAGFAGGFSLLPLTASVGGGAGIALSGLQNSQTLNSLLTSQSPEALRELNRARLLAMMVDDEVAEAFVENQWLSPRHETTIVAALVGLEGAKNISAMVEHATVSESENQSIFLMRQAEATLGFHQNVAAIVSLSLEDGAVTGITTDNRTVSAVPADHLIWSAGAKALADQSVSGDATRELWLTGSISDRAKAEFEQRGWAVVAEESDRLAPDLDAGLVEDEDSGDE
ncbi:MAG: hypothetical protein HN793_03830 [Rhodospirillaceae bacterium]|jgi:hypothetical protein|nr:hypothetical protein [Rhodospirillaceae bacterium]MBT5565859.1 hypothetical protein [Rhodospirillaceae bacterium]MBT6088719.1 hypothetical protein [Rhodospirillaceae bacterium]MBT7449935.1 hypothetical protein [Rhodospirillaceae bacterium]